jgi:hypothetical protein
MKYLKEINKKLNLEDEKGYFNKEDDVIDIDIYAKSISDKTNNSEYEKVDLKFLKRIKTFDLNYNLVYLGFIEVKLYYK